MGFMCNKFAYIIDCHEIPNQLLAELREAKLELLLLDCVLESTHKTHLWKERAFEYDDFIQARSTGLIHISNKLDHDILEHDCKQRRQGLFVTYDQLQLTL